MQGDCAAARISSTRRAWTGRLFARRTKLALLALVTALPARLPAQQELDPTPTHVWLDEQPPWKKLPLPWIFPAGYLRSAAQGADELRLIRRQRPGQPTRPALVVSGKKEVERFLALLETPAVEWGDGSRFRCAGHPVVELYRRRQRLLAFEVGHLLGTQDPIWPAGDVSLTAASWRALDRWFGRHGYARLREEGGAPH